MDRTRFQIRRTNAREFSREQFHSPNRVLLNKVGMPMNQSTVYSLSPSEKLQLIEDLWDDLAANPSDVPVQDWQLEELERRKARLQEDPASGLSWNEVKERVRRRHGR